MGGRPVVLKQFAQERRGALDAYVRELAVYAHLAATSLPGTVTPRLLLHGMIAVTANLFLALEDEGDDLGALAAHGHAITAEMRAQMKDALRALHA